MSLNRFGIVGAVVAVMAWWQIGHAPRALAAGGTDKGVFANAPVRGLTPGQPPDAAFSAGYAAAGAAGPLPTEAALAAARQFAADTRARYGDGHAGTLAAEAALASLLHRAGKGPEALQVVKQQANPRLALAQYLAGLSRAQAGVSEMTNFLEMAVVPPSLLKMGQPGQAAWQLNQIKFMGRFGEIPNGMAGVGVATLATAGIQVAYGNAQPLDAGYWFDMLGKGDVAILTEVGLFRPPTAAPQNPGSDPSAAEAGPLLARLGEIHGLGVKGKAKQALAAERALVEETVRTLGPDDHRTGVVKLLTSINPWVNPARQGDYDQLYTREAMALRLKGLAEAREVFVKTRGEDHPVVAEVDAWLALNTFGLALRAHGVDECTPRIAGCQEALTKFDQVIAKPRRSQSKEWMAERASYWRAMIGQQMGVPAQTATVRDSQERMEVLTGAMQDRGMLGAVQAWEDPTPRLFQKPVFERYAQWLLGP